MPLKIDSAVGDLTTFGTGFASNEVFVVNSLEDFESLSDVSVIGFGSNSLLPDNHSSRLLKLGKSFSGWGTNLAVRGELSEHLQVGASCPLMTLSRLCTNAGLSGLEFAGGIPGSLGGAVKMNAGAHGAEISDILTSVTVYSLTERSVHTYTPQDLKFGYRSSSLKCSDVVLSAKLKLSLKSATDTKKLYRANLAYRSATQPLKQKSFGSVFTNPQGQSAGELLEDCGLKGFSIGGAAFSDLHANWIVRTSSEATTADALKLIKEGKKRALEQKGVDLVPEVVLF